MMRKTIFLLGLAFFLGLACTIGTPLEQVPTPQDGTLMPTSTTDPDAPQATFTAIAQTVMAEITSIAGTPTLTPTRTPTITPTPPDNPTTTPTETPTPTLTITPLATFTPIFGTQTPTIPCNAASFVADVTVAENTTFSPHIEFTKIWRIENVGSCSWTDDYVLLFSSGEPMRAQTTHFLSGTVNPGDTLDIAVEMEAPETPNVYQGFWMLQSADGKLFGIGDNFDVPLPVKIQVIAPEPGQYFNFAVNMCASVWTNEDGSLPCPGERGSESGFVATLFEPALENRRENEPALWMFPKKEEKGWISGTYPALDIESGDHFITYVGCLANSPQCNLTFQLDYQVEGTNTIFNLGQWEETFDGEITSIDLDLSSLAGQEVIFIFTVKAKASPDDDNAFWLSPHIRR